MGRTACTEPQCLYKGALDLALPLRALIPRWRSAPEMHGEFLEN